MKCPKCESDNTQRLEVAFLGGTQNISTTSNTAGIGISSGGRIGFGGGITTTQGQTQSVLAATCAPPAKKPTKFLKFGIFGGVICLISSSWVLALWGLLSIGFCGYRHYQWSQFNAKEWPNIYKHWAESWLCHKCGSIYHQA